MKNAFGIPQTLLLLGAGSDIGVATAKALVENGTTTVVLAGRHPDDYLDTADALRDSGATRVEIVRFDAANTASHQAVMDDIVARVGDIDASILAWGILGVQATAEQDPAEAVGIAQVNFVGAVSIGVLLANRIREQGSGTIVVLSSVAGERARRSNFVYGSSKAGLDTFFSGLGDALRGSGGRVLVVRPGFVVSKMTEGMEPVPFSTTPEAVAAAICNGLRRRDEELWVPAVLRVVMSGIRHAPRPIFRKLPL